MRISKIHEDYWRWDGKTKNEYALKYVIKEISSDGLLRRASSESHYFERSFETVEEAFEYCAENNFTGVVILPIVELVSSERVPPQPKTKKKK